MNRIIVYTVVAILLGTVTMFAPLALLESSAPIQEGRYNISEVTEEKLEHSDLWTKPEAQAEPNAFDIVPEDPAPCEVTLSETDVASSMSSIGLITVPSLLVALGVFVYLKKRMMM